MNDKFHLTNCGWCNEKTPKIYRLKDGKYLCVNCATKHYNLINDKMTKHIETIQAGLNKKYEKLKKFKQYTCKHQNAIDTNFCVGVKNSKEIWECPDCGKTIYK